MLFLGNAMRGAKVVLWCLGKESQPGVPNLVCVCVSLRVFIYSTAMGQMRCVEAECG